MVEIQLAETDRRNLWGWFPEIARLQGQCSYADCTHTIEKGCAVLDAPICRGRFFADEGTLLALFGGTDDVVARSRPVYSCFCSDIAHVGEVGHGTEARGWPS